MYSIKFKYLFFFLCVLVVVLVRYDLQISIRSNFVEKIFYSMKSRRNFRPNLSQQKSALLNLTKIIQQRIRQRQFPPNCSNVKTLRCDYIDSGFGSQMHFRAICLIAAYTTGRTWIPDWKKPFVYSPLVGWDGYFLPVTNCTDNDNDAVDVMQIESIFYESQSMPPAFPAEFAETLLRYHSYPPLFWVGQFQAFLIRYQPFLEKYVSDKMAKLRFEEEPMVGVHVRRGDKLKHESETFSIDEYMEHVITWFNTIGRKKRRRILLLSDEEGVLREAVDKYPAFEFIYDSSIFATNFSDPYTHENLLDVVSAIHMLSRCTFVVCTFSSNICRLAYELGQVFRLDDSTDRFVSLDSLYYFWDQQHRYQIATDNHSANGDIELFAGDLLVVNDNPWLLSDTPWLASDKHRSKKRIFDGRFEGRNLMTGKFGRYPLSKVREKWITF